MESNNEDFKKVIYQQVSNSILKLDKDLNEMIFSNENYSDQEYIEKFNRARDNFLIMKNRITSIKK